VLTRKNLDGERLTDLMAPLGLSWKERARAELALMEELEPLLQSRADGREISGLRYMRASAGTIVNGGAMVPKFRFPHLLTQHHAR